MSDERRVVTVLFADVTGSTALGERLDPEDLRALRHATSTNRIPVDARPGRGGG